jgi:hypothetical protein
VGAPVTFAVTVSGAGGAPTGTVQFFDGATPLGSATLVNRTGTLTVSTLAAGVHSISARYSGDSAYSQSSSSAISQNITSGAKTRSSSTVSASANPAAVGQAVTLTVTVQGAGGTPTGIVQIFDGNRWLDFANLSNGRATFTLSTLAAGTHSIGVAYSGDSSFTTNASAPYSLVIR